MKPEFLKLSKSGKFYQPQASSAERTARLAAANFGNDDYAPKTQKKWCLTGKDITRKAYWLTFILIHANTILSILPYLALIILEHAFAVFMLLIGSYPYFAKAPDTPSLKNETADGLFQEHIHLEGIHIFPFIQHDLDSNNQIEPSIQIDIQSITSLSSISIVVSLSFLGLCITMATLLIILFLRSTGFEWKGQKIFPRLLAIWAGLHRTVLTYLLAFSIVTIGLSISNSKSPQFLSSNLNSSNSTSSSSAMIGTQETSNEYYLSVILSLGVVSFFLTFCVSIYFMRVPLDVKRLPWNSSSTRNILFKEIFKFIIVAQDYFLSELGITSSYSVHSAYQAFLCIFLVGLSLYEPPRFFQSQINIAYMICSRILLCVGFMCMFRVIIVVELLQYLIYSPFLAYAFIKALVWTEERSRRQSLKNLVLYKRNSALSSYLMLQYLSQVLEKLRGDPNQSNAEGFLGIELTADEQQTLFHIHHCHKLTCQDQMCICRQYEFITHDIFVKSQRTGESLTSMFVNCQNGMMMDYKKQLSVRQQQYLFTHNKSVVSSSHGGGSQAPGNSFTFTQTNNIANQTAGGAGVSSRRIDVNNFSTAQSNQLINNNSQMMGSTEQQSMYFSPKATAIMKTGMITRGQGDGNTLAQPMNPLFKMLLRRTSQSKMGEQKKEQLNPIYSSFRQNKGENNSGHNHLGSMKKHVTESSAGGEKGLMEVERADDHQNMKGYGTSMGGALPESSQMIDQRGSDANQALGEVISYSALQENIKLEDLFIRDSHDLPQIGFSGHSNWRRNLKSVDEYPSKFDFRRHVLSFNFKNKDEAKAYYFIMLIGQIVNEYGKDVLQDPDINYKDVNMWLEFRLLYVQFINMFMNRPFLAIQNLLLINYQHNDKMAQVAGDSQSSLSSDRQMSALAKIKFAVCEQLIMIEILKNISSRQSNALTEGQDGSQGDSSNISPSASMFSQYIDRSNQLKSLDDLYDETASEIIDFWRLWSSAEPNIHKIFDLGRHIARSIAQIKEEQLQIEESSSQLFIDQNRYNIHILFHLSLLSDSATANAMQTMLRNRVMFISSKKPSGFNEGRQMLNDNYSDSLNLGGGGGPIESESTLADHAVCLVSACSGDANQLEFLYANRQFATLIGVKDSHLIGRNIKIIMPASIREHHDAFIKNFFAKGSPKVLGRQRVVFIKDGQGFLRPVRFKLEFCYDYKFKYTFIGSFEKVMSVNMFAEERTRISLRDAMIFLTDEHYQIQEVSQNVLHFTGFDTIEHWKAVQDSRGRPFNLDNIIVDLDQLMSRYKEVMPPDPTSADHCEDYFSIKNKVFKFRRYNSAVDDFALPTNTHGHNEDFEVVLTYLQENFAISTVRQRVFIAIPVRRFPDYEQILRMKTNETIFEENEEANLAERALMMGQAIIRNHVQEEEFEQFKAKIEEHPNPAYNSSRHEQTYGNSGTRTNLMNSDNGIRGRNNLMADQAFNDMGPDEGEFELNSQSSASSQTSTLDSQIHKNYLFQSRPPKILALCVYILISMLLAFLIVSVYNLSVFIMKHSDISSRIQSYYLATKRNVNYRLLLLDLQVLHQLTLLSNYTYDIDSSFANQEKSRIEEYSDLFYKHLEMARSTTLEFDQFNQLLHTDQGYFQTFTQAYYLSNEGHSYKQNKTIRNEFDIFLAYLEQFDLQQLAIEKPSLNISNYPDRISASGGPWLSTETERLLYFIFQNGLESMNEIGQKQILQISTESGVRAESSRETLNITTFVSVSIVSIILLAIIPLFVSLQQRQYNVIEFLQYLTKDSIDQAIERSIEYQRRLMQVAIMENEDLQQLLVMNSEDAEMNDYGFSMSSKDYKQILGKTTNAVMEMEKKLLAKTVKNSKSPKKTARKSRAPETSDFKLKPKNTRHYSDDFEESKSDRHSHINEESSPTGSRRIQEESNDDKENISDDIKKKGKSKTPKEPETMPIEDQASYNKAQQIQAQIMRANWRSKIAIFIIVLVCIGYLNSSLLVSLYYSNQVFLNNEESTDKMKIFFGREQCAYNSLLFMREKLIRNQTFETTVYTSLNDFTIQQAVPYFIRYCLSTEKDIAQVQKSLPSYLLDAEVSIEYQQSSSMCNTTFLNNPQKLQQCQSAMEGLLLNGMDAVMSYLIALITQININFDSQPGKRTIKFLNENLNSERLQEMIDLVILYMRDSFILVQDSVMASLVNYFSKARNYYLLIFCLFTSFTTLLSILAGLVLYRKVKQTILDTQNILVLLPLRDLQPWQRAKIERFLQS